MESACAYQLREANSRSICYFQIICSLHSFQHSPNQSKTASSYPCKMHRFDDGDVPFVDTISKLMLPDRKRIIRNEAKPSQEASICVVSG